MGRTFVICILCAVLDTTSIASERPIGDMGTVDAESLRLCTEVQARIWSDGSFPAFIDWPELELHPMIKKTAASLLAAEEALRLDSGNLYAQALLARLYLSAVDTDDLAAESWALLFEHGLGVSFAGVLSYRDARIPLIVHFERAGLALYSYTALGVGADADAHADEAVPDATHRLYWEVQAGRIPPGLAPAMVISWDNVSEIDTSEQGWRVGLAKEIRLEKLGGRGVGSELFLEFKTGIESFPWDLDWYDFRYSEVDTTAHTFGPLEYHNRLRDVVLRLVSHHRTVRAP